jgi:hypothetical protein
LYKSAAIIDARIRPYCLIGQYAIRDLQSETVLGFPAGQLRLPSSSQTPVLPETIQTYLILTNDSVPVTLPFGSYFEVYGSSGGNTVNVRMGARVRFQNFTGPNEINVEEASSRFTVPALLSD